MNLAQLYYSADLFGVARTFTPPLWIPIICKSFPALRITPAPLWPGSVDN